MYYIGVDGGGTKTKYVAVDENLKIVSETERGTTHVQQIGKENLENEIKAGIEKILKEGNIKKEEVKGIVLGIPGYGESESDKKNIDEVMEKVLDGYNYKVENDCVLGWAAGTLCKEGMNIIAGTGSMIFGMNDEGKQGRVGGFGPIIGDDGSACDIGIKVINEYTKQKDGRHEKTILVDILEKEKEIKDYFGIVELIFNRYNLSRTEMAKFSIIGSKAAKEGCGACKKIFEQAAYELFLHVKALKKQLKIKDGFILSYSGGVFKGEELILNPLEKYLKESNIECTIKKPEIQPCIGAALMALKLK